MIIASCDTSIYFLRHELRIGGGQAAVDAFKLRVHAVTSNQENWHLLYEADDEEPPERDWFHGTANSRFPEVGGTGSSCSMADSILLLQARRKVFVTYIAPVHFNSILPDREKAAARTKGDAAKGDCCEATGYGHCDAEEGSEAEADNHQHVADQPDQSDQPVAAAQPDTSDAETEETARDMRNAERLVALTAAGRSGSSPKTTTTKSAHHHDIVI